jgi:hypothetical protein
MDIVVELAGVVICLEGQVSRNSGVERLFLTAERRGMEGVK